MNKSNNHLYLNTFPDDTILYDNNTEGSIASTPGTRDFGVYNDYSQRITFQPETSMDAKRFSCNIEHEGYDATAGEDVKSTWFEIKVVGNVNLNIPLQHDHQIFFKDHLFQKRTRFILSPRLS